MDLDLEEKEKVEVIAEAPPPNPNEDGEGVIAGIGALQLGPDIGETLEEGVSQDGDGDGDDDDVKVACEARKVNEVAGAEGNDEITGGGTPVQSSEGEEDIPEEEDEEAHPCLSNENVLEVIFKHIVNQPGSRKDVGADVQSIRQVCWIWKDSVTQVYRRTRPPMVFHGYTSQGQQYPGTLSHFMNVMRSSAVIPVQKFRFQHNVFYHQGDLNLFQDFFRICGPEVVSLDFSLESEAAERLTPTLKALPFQDLNMPKLKTLVLGICENHQSEVQIDASKIHGLVELVQLLLTASKMLQEFQLSFFLPHRPTPKRNQASIVSQLNPGIHMSIPRTLKNLNLYMEMNETAFDNMAGVGLKLERFQFGVPSLLWDKSLYKFLQSQAASLEDLRIGSRTGNEKGIFVQFPRLDELLHLELNDAVITLPPGSSFGDTFPKLTCLEIPGMVFDDAFRALLSSAKNPPPSLKVLHLPVWRYKSFAPFVKDVAKAFPGIVELHLVLYQQTRETLGEVFIYFDKLESLNITFAEGIVGEDWAESLLSGISTDDCSDIRKRGNFGNETIIEFQSRPSILNLTRLRKLSIRKYPLGDPVILTDLSAHFLFLEMDALREIHLIDSTNDVVLRFSPIYADLMRDNLRFLREGADNLI